MMTAEERKHARRVLDSNYAKTLEAVRYVVAADHTVTTTELIKAGVLSGPEVNGVMATALTLGWAFFYPMRTTQRWFITNEGKVK